MKLALAALMLAVGALAIWIAPWQFYGILGFGMVGGLAIVAAYPSGGAK